MQFFCFQMFRRNGLLLHLLTEQYPHIHLNLIFEISRSKNLVHQIGFFYLFWTRCLQATQAIKIELDFSIQTIDFKTQVERDKGIVVLVASNSIPRCPITVLKSWRSLCKEFRKTFLASFCNSLYFTFLETELVLLMQAGLDYN